MLKELGSLGQAVRAIEEVIRERSASGPEAHMWDENMPGELVGGPGLGFSAEQWAIIVHIEATTTSTFSLTK